MVVLVRCDDRLIHGQCMTVIIQHYAVKRIIVVDDFTANNPILKTVFKSAAPPSIETDVFTVDASAAKIASALSDDVRTLVLMKSPLVYKQLMEKLPELPRELNVGPQSNRAGTTMLTKFINCLPEEIKCIREIADAGCHVYFRQIPTQETIEWEDIKQKF